MVKRMFCCLSLLLVIASAAPLFAQDEFPKFQMAPGYGNLAFGVVGFGIPKERHSGFTMDTDFNVSPWLGGTIFTGYYSLGNGLTLYSNTFGAVVSLRKNSHVVPFGTAGFGFASLEGTTAMATRYGGGVDIPFSDAMAIRFGATRTGFHFDHNWGFGSHYSVGVVLNLSQ